MDLMEVMERLYAAEINVSIESDWDNGFTVAIGNQRSGVVASEHFEADGLDRAAEWLDKKARELYPNAV